MSLKQVMSVVTIWLLLVSGGLMLLQREHGSALDAAQAQAESDLLGRVHLLSRLVEPRPGFSEILRRLKPACQEAGNAELVCMLVDGRGAIHATSKPALLGANLAALVGQDGATLLGTLEGARAARVFTSGDRLLAGQVLLDAAGRGAGLNLVLVQDRVRLLESLDNSHTRVVTLMVGLVLGSALFMLLYLQTFQGPRLRRLGMAIGRFADGDGNARANLDGNDAVAHLAGLFDDMAARFGEERNNLSESEERLKFALHGSNAGIWDWRIDTAHTYFSPRWKSLLGFGENEILPHSEEWLKRVHPDDLARVMTLLNGHMTGATPFFESEHRLRRKSDDYIWVLERGVVLRDESGRPYRMVGALTDISRRKEVESALQRSEEAYRTVVNGVNQIIFRCDTQGRLSFLNPAWLDLTGIPLEAGLGHTLNEFIYSDDRDLASQLILSASRHASGTVAGEIRLVPRAGGARWFSLHAGALQGEGGDSGIAGVLTDIDDLKQAQDALTQSNKERNAILDLSPDGYLFVDAEARVVYVNPAFLIMTGTVRGQIVGRSLTEIETLVHGLCDASKPMPQFSAAVDDVESQIHLQAPVQRVLKWLVRHIRDQYGRLQAGVIFFRDVTDQFEIDRMKSEFLSTAAHELRTPMASIFGFAELLLAREFDVATQRDLLQRIHRQTKNLINLVNELLDLARIEARGSKSFKFKIQDLVGPVQTTLGSFFVPHETHRLSVDLPDSLAQVNIDAEKFQQALMNVLGNALKYSPEGGEIRVGMVRRSHNGKEYVGIAVRDEGIGMTPEQMARMFDRFYRADNSGAIPGTGLGMCLVREIMTIFEGQVTVSSVLGQGTEVTLWLPLAGNGEEGVAA